MTHIYRFNQYVGKYYLFDYDSVDINSPMFDDILHDNNRTPCMENVHTCGYCNTQFAKRSQLFNHLGYMGIDIRPYADLRDYNKSGDSRSSYKYGDEGMVFNHRHVKRISSYPKTPSALKWFRRRKRGGPDNNEQPEVKCLRQAFTSVRL